MNLEVYCHIALPFIGSSLLDLILKVGLWRNNVSGSIEVCSDPPLHYQSNSFGGQMKKEKPSKYTRP